MDTSKSGSFFSTSDNQAAQQYNLARSEAEHGTEESDAAPLPVRLSLENPSPKTNNLSLDPPIFHLPFEISAEIFISYTKGMESDDENSGSGRSSPLLLGAICKTWREIALTTPRLWTTINISIPSFAKIPLLTELAGSWMARSGDLPLTISLSISKFIANLVRSHQEEFSPLFEVLRSFSTRWRQIILEIPADLYASFIGSLTIAPLLNDLRLIPIVYQELLSTVDFHLDEAPRLTHLEISRLYVAKIIIPWHNLTSIEVFSVYVDEMIELLTSAIQLVSSRFAEICGVQGLFPLPSTPLTHQCLRHLNISPDDSDSATEFPLFLRSVTFPSLESFVYETKEDFPVDELLSLFTRSRSPIKNFEIVVTEADSDHDLGVTEIELIRLLEGIPTITNLSVSLLGETLTKILSDHFISRLFLSPTFLPDLEVLSFVGYRGFSWKCIADLLLAIPVDAPKIRRINIRVNLNTGYIDMPSLSRLVHLESQHPRTTFNIIEHITGMDVIAASLEFHWPAY